MSFGTPDIKKTEKDGKIVGFEPEEASFMSVTASRKSFELF